VWFNGGYLLFHSNDVFISWCLKVVRFTLIASHIIKIKNRIATIERYDPIEEIMFHVINASGYSEYRRGIPFNPKKCWGKKVRFTPTNIKINWTFSHLLFILIENIIGNQ